MLGTIIAFVLGAGTGFAYARWLAANNVTDDVPDVLEAAQAEIEPVDLIVPAVVPRAKPNKKARKAGLTEADFTPSDDILERLRLAQAGRLDPAVLGADGTPAAPTDATADHEAEPDEPDEPETKPETKPPVPERRPEVAASDPAALAEAERRVLERLRRMAGQESEGAGED